MGPRGDAPDQHASRIARPAMTDERFPRTSLLDVDDEELELDLDGLAYRGSVIAIVAPTGSGKTLFAERLLLDVVRQDRTPAHFDMEIGGRGTKRNYRAHGATDAEMDRIHYIELPEPRLDEAGEFVRSVIDNGEEVALLDKLPDFLRSAGKAENSNDDISDWAAEFLDPLREKCTVIVLHATGWEGKRMRGASELGFKLDVVWEMSVLEEFDKHRIGRLRLKCTKDRWGDIGTGKVIEYAFGGDGQGAVICQRLGETYESAVDATDAKERAERAANDLLRRSAAAAARKHAPDEDHAVAKSTLEGLVGGNATKARKAVDLAIGDVDPSHARLGKKPNPKGKGIVVWFKPAQVGEEAES